MADEQAVYESIAQTMRDYGYRDVTAAVVREIDEGSPTEKRPGVISMFAARELERPGTLGCFILWLLRPSSHRDRSMWNRTANAALQAPL